MPQPGASNMLDNLLTATADGACRAVAQPPESGSYQAYAEYLDTLFGVEAILDRGKGYLNWLKGRALLKAKKALQTGEFRQLVKRYDIKRSTMYACLKIARNITEDEARKSGTTLRKMLADLGWRCFEPNDTFVDAGDEGLPDEPAPDPVAEHIPPHRRRQKNLTEDVISQRLNRTIDDLRGLVTFRSKLDEETARDWYTKTIETLRHLVQNADKAMAEFQGRLDKLAARPKRDSRGRVTRAS